jgi:hypothetical protein
MTGLIAVGSPAAQASDELAGALIGAGAGAIVGSAVGGRDAAVFGGFLGAILGAAIADDDDRGGPRPHSAYGPPPARYHYTPPPQWNGPRHAYPGWQQDRDVRHDRAWDRTRDGWRDDRRDNDRNGWNKNPGPRRAGANDYRNW